MNNEIIVYAECTNNLSGKLPLKVGQYYKARYDLKNHTVAFCVTENGMNGVYKSFDNKYFNIHTC